MRVIVTGARSFIGSHTVRRLKEAGAEVTELRHSFEEAEESLPQRADVWIHFAWAGRGPLGRADRAIQEKNIDMSMAALKKARELGVQSFLFAGSQAEYGRELRPHIREDSPCDPVREYGKAKKAFSELARSYLEAEQKSASDRQALPVPGFIHLRIFSVYGPGDREDSLISSAIRLFSRDEPMELSNCGQLWDYMYVKDTADAIVMMALGYESTGPGSYEAINIAGEDIRPLREYVKELRELMGSSSELRFGKRASNIEGSGDLAPDISKLRGLGFREVYSFSRGIKETLSYSGYKGRHENNEVLRK